MFETARGIHQVLSKPVLSTLVKNKGCSIFYTHLGKIHNTEQPFTDEATQAFELLASFQQKKQILTATTRRLLGYTRTFEEIAFKVKLVGDETQIHLTTAHSGEDLNGLTWYVDEPMQTHLFINGVEFRSLELNAADETGRPSVSIKWEPLRFPFQMSGN